MLWCQLRKLGSGDARTRLRAAEDLAQARNPRSVAPLIALLVRNPQRETRMAAAGVLGFIGDRRALEPLVATLADADAGVRKAAALAIGAIGEQENHEVAAAAQAALAGFTDDPDEHVRRVALAADLRRAGGNWGPGGEGAQRR